jgi:hypothetical protein
MMDAPMVTVSEQLKQELTNHFEPKKVEVPQPNTGFAALDNPAGSVEVNAEPQTGSVDVNKTVAEPPADFDKRMAKIIAQSQKVQAERQAFAAEQAKLKADMDELARFRELKARAKDDPVSVAETFGYKPDEYATVLMEKGSLTPERRKILEQQQELNDLKSWRAKQEEERKQAEAQRHYVETRQGLEKFAGESAEQYDLVLRTKNFDRVLAKVQELINHAKQTGEEVENPWDYVPQAFDHVERELEEYFKPMLESPKFKTASVVAEQPNPTAPLLQSAARKPVGTINSKLRAQSAAPKELTEAERFQKAGEVLLGQIYGRRG